MADKKFTDKDQKLFREIEIDVKKHPDKYREAGKWLDKYYDIEKFWERKELYYENLKSKERYFEKDELGYVPDELFEEMAFWSAMIEAKTYLHINKLRDIYEAEKKQIQAKRKAMEILDMPVGTESDGSDIAMDAISGKCDFLNEDISRQIKSELDDCKQIAGGVQIIYRLLDACDYLLKKAGEFVSLEDAKRICLITWLLSDPDADKANLDLTQFEKWSWSTEYISTKSNSGRCEVFSLLEKEKWTGLGRRAWDEIQAAKEYETEQENKEMPPNYIPCIEIAVIIRKRSDAIARSLKAANYPVFKKVGKNYCNPEHAAVLFPKWKKHLKRQQENE